MNMKTNFMKNAIFYESRNQKLSNQLTKEFKTYLERIKDYLIKSDSEENDEHLEMLNFIQCNAGLEKNNSVKINYIKNINTLVKEKSFLDREEEVNKILSLYLKKVNLEKATFENRKVDKTLSITNEMYANLEATLLKLKKESDQEWIKINLKNTRESNFNKMEIINSNELVSIGDKVIYFKEETKIK